MGTSHSQIYNDDLFKEFHKPQWIKLKDQGLYELWSNSNTSQLCQAYRLEQVPREQDLEHYRFRHYKQNADNFVEIRYLDLQQNPSLCHHAQTYVLTEFIPVKLSEMDNLTLNDGFLLLRSSYRAFHTMQAFHGPFIPNEDLIGLNLHGKPKIWLNKNHSKNKADSAIKAQIWQKHVGEVSENVKRIFQMVQQRVNGKRFPPEFRDYIYDNIMNFSQASQFVEDYCQGHRIAIPTTIQYTRFLRDESIIKIINDYNMKRQSATLNDKSNTMESTYEHDKMVKDHSIQEIKRADSHKILGNLERTQYVRPSHAFNLTPNPHVKTYGLVQRAIVSPVIQRTSNAHIIIPPRGQIIHQVNRQSRVSGPQITIPSQANLRSTISVMQMQPIPRQVVQAEPQRVIQYQNLITPVHVVGNFTIVPPSKITQFQVPHRKQSDHAESIQSGSIAKESNQAQSIHEKIKDFQNDYSQYLNEAGANTANFYVKRQEQPHQQELRKYINDNSKHQPQESEQYHESVTSEPDWETIQQQNHQKANKNEQQRIQYEEYRYEPQPYEADLEIDQIISPSQYNHRRQEQSLISRPDDVSPIKENPFKNTQQFQNHYAMFTKYANPHLINQNQQKKQFNQHEEDHRQQQNNVAKSAQFQPRNLNLRQSVTMSDQEPDNISDIQVQENQISVVQPHQISPQESSQQIYRNSSKNTSLNKQSSGTLIVHESQQNIYNGVSNQERSYQIKQESIQQNSQQSENEEEDLDENQVRKQMMNQLLMENNEKEIRDQYEHFKQREFHEVPVRDLDLDREVNDWKNDNHYDEVRQSKDIQSREQQGAYLEKVNQYSNLHFRNESDELYQYTPVESVYRTQPGNHVFPSFSRPSSVQDIVQLERHQDIEDYIRKKYAGMIQGNPLPPKQNQNQPKQRSSKNSGNRTMTFAKPPEPQTSQKNQVQTKQYIENNSNAKSKFGVNRIQSLYQRIDHFDSHITSQKHNNRSQVYPFVQTHDFLDVGNLQKSLDQKYKHLAENSQIKVASPKNSHNIRGSQTMSQEDGMNVAALEQRLLKFEERQSIEREKSQRKIEVQIDEPLSSNQELNFNELDNIVELMDKKIQQSQKKQQNKSSHDLKSSQKVSQFVPGKHSNGDPLSSVELQTSINNIDNKEISLKDIPVLAKDMTSNASNSKPTSKRDYYSKYGIDSEDFATGRGVGSNDYGVGKESYSFNKRQSKNYQSKKLDSLNPVIELERKYENYSSKNMTSNEYDLSALNNGLLSSSQVQRKFSRRSSKQVEEAKRLAEKISSKYDQYMSSETSSNFEIEKPFAKKSYTHINDTYDNNENYVYPSNGSSKYISSSSKQINEQVKKVSKGSRVSQRDIERKRSSYLNPIEELNCQNYASPLKESTPYQNQQNYLKLSHENSRASSARNFDNKSRKSSAKVSYDQLRDLLWK